jgi:hypothetical protein
MGGAMEIYMECVLNSINHADGILDFLHFVRRRVIPYA